MKLQINHNAATLPEAFDIDFTKQADLFIKPFATLTANEKGFIIATLLAENCSYVEQLAVELTCTDEQGSILYSKIKRWLYDKEQISEVVDELFTMLTDSEIDKAVLIARVMMRTIVENR